MNEIQTNNFDYSVLDSYTAEYLKDRENSMSKTLENAAEKLGEDLYKAQQKLAKNGYGQFEEWYTSLGLKKRSVYNYIDRYSFVQNLHKQEEIEVFQELTPSLKNEMSKPSANPEVNQKVFDGDITTHKEYVALEKKLKDAEHNAESHKNWYHEIATKLQRRDEENEILQSKLEDAENKEPEVIERYSEPDDYQETKRNLEHMKQMVDGKQQQIEKFMKEIADMRAKRSDMDKKSKEYDELNQAINDMNGRLSDGQLRLKNQKAVYDLIKDSKKLVSDVAPLVYAIEWLDLEDNEYAQKPLREIAKNLNDIAQKINQKLEEKEIIEVN